MRVVRDELEVPARSQMAGQAAQASTNGRVVATVTTLEGTVQLPGAQVELREQPTGTVLATTISDGAGQVVFPDVPPGRYTLGAVRPGFVDSVSTAFDVRANEVSNVLLDVQLTFTVPDGRRRGQESVADRQRAAGVDERHARWLADGVVAARGRRFPEPDAAAAGRRPRTRWPAARQGRTAHAGGTAGEQREPDRSVDWRLRSRIARRRASSRSRCWPTRLPPSTGASRRA